MFLSGCVHYWFVSGYMALCFGRTEGGNGNGLLVSVFTGVASTGTYISRSLRTFNCDTWDLSYP